MMSRRFYIISEIQVFFRLIFLTRAWIIEMMECWNNNLKKMIFLYLIAAKRNFTITQHSIFPETKYSSVPIFQHSPAL